MFKAMLLGKRSGLDQSAQSESFTWKASEDFLTAAFFTRIRYLDGETQKRILFRPECIPGVIGNGHWLSNIDFWPRHPDPFVAGKEVEPDAIISTVSERTIIIESKISDEDGLQTGQQLAKEIAALAIGCQSNEPVHIIAMGGAGYNVSDAEKRLSKECKTELAVLSEKIDFNLVVLPWKTVMERVASLRQEFSPQNPMHAVLGDMHELLEHYGFGSKFLGEKNGLYSDRIESFSATMALLKEMGN